MEGGSWVKVEDRKEKLKKTISERPWANANSLSVRNRGLFIDSYPSDEELPTLLINKSPSSIFVSHLIVTTLGESKATDETLAQSQQRQ